MKRKVEFLGKQLVLSVAKMELTPVEASARVQFVDGDFPQNYGNYYHLPFALILEVAHRLPPTIHGALPAGCNLQGHNWTPWLQGYKDWAAPDRLETDDDDEMQMRYMQMMSNSYKYGFDMTIQKCKSARCLPLPLRGSSKRSARVTYTLKWLISYLSSRLLFTL